MKRNILLYAALWIVLCSHAQKQFIHTASKENISCNYDCTRLDAAELDNNAAAVIFVTPVLEKGINVNPHLIGVYYFKTKWNIFNLDGRPIPAGAKFAVEYFPRPDDTHFQYSFSKADIQQDGSAFIDHPALNNNPTVQFISFPSWNTDSQGATTNREEIKIEYNIAAGRWSVSNVNKKPLFARVTYNISISAAGEKKIITPRTAVQIKELAVTPNNNPFFGTVGYMYMTAWADGIKLPGDNIVTAHLDQTQVYGFEMGALSPATLLSSGKKVYEPITIKMQSGWPVAIPLLNAFIKNQNMVFNIETFSNSPSGQQGLNYTIKLTGARVVSFKQVYDEDRLSNGISTTVKKVYDEIRVMFTKIEYINSVGAIATDNL